MRRFAISMGLIAALAACSGSSDEDPGRSAPVLHVEQLRVVLANAPQGESVAYFIIRNDGAEADRLLSAATPLAERIDIHETRAGATGASGDFSIPEGLPIPAQSEVRLQPGGLHLAFRNPSPELKAGERAPLTLTFERTGAMQFEALVAASP